MTNPVVHWPTVVDPLADALLTSLADVPDNETTKPMDRI